MNSPLFGTRQTEEGFCPYKSSRSKMARCEKVKKSGIFSVSIPPLCLICDHPLSRETCILPCGHAFCRLCIAKRCCRSHLCPSCGEAFSRLAEAVNSQNTGFQFSAKAFSQLYAAPQSPPRSNAFVPCEPDAQPADSPNAGGRICTARLTIRPTPTLVFQ
jgi:hypothetical protein